MLNDILSRTIKTETGCLEWTLGRTVRGYGRIKYKGKDRRVHRIVWELENGEIPKGMFVCHTCDNPPCCNLDHLFLGTHSDNMKDMWRKGRNPKGLKNIKGEKHPRSILTETQVLEILNSKDPVKKLSKAYRISDKTIYKIKAKNSWKHLWEKQNINP